MGFSRRDFLLSLSGVAVGAVPNVVRSQQGPNRDLVKLGVAAGLQTDPLVALLAQKVAVRVQGATQAQAAALQREAQLARSHLNAFNGVQLRRAVAKSSFLREIGFTTAVVDAVGAGTLVPTVTGFSEMYRPDVPSFLDSAMATIGSRIRNASQAEAGRVVETAAFALGYDGLKAIDVPKLATASLQAGVTQLWDGAASAAQLQSKGAAFLAPLLKVSQDQVQAAALLSVSFKKQEQAPGKDTFSFEFTPALKDIRAGVAVCDAVLTLMGDAGQPLRQDLRRVTQAAQSAIQLYQAAAVLASASGFGTVIALSGMLNGAGGVSAFAGLFGGGGQQARDNSEVLAAIDTLRKEMRKEFGNVNAKLDWILGRLDTLLEAIRRVGGQVEQALVLLRQANEQVSVVLQRINENTFILVDEGFQKVQNNCRRRIDEKKFDDASMDVCRTDLGHYGSLLNKRPFQYAGAPSAAETLASTFRNMPGAQQAPNGPDNYWHAAKALQEMADAARTPVAGMPAYEPGLIVVMNLLVELKTKFPKLYPMQNDTQAAAVRKVYVSHFEFKGSLMNGSISSYLHSSFRQVLREFENQCWAHWRAKAEALAGKEGRPGHGALKLSNASGAPTQGNYVVMGSNEVKAEGPLKPSYLECLTRPCADWPLTVAVTRFSALKADTEQLQTYHQIEVDFVLRYDGSDLHIPSVTVKLPDKEFVGPANHVDAVKWARMQQDPVYALTVLGPTEELRLAVAEMVGISGSSIRDRQVRKLYDNPNAQVSRMAWMELLNSPQVGGGDAGLKIPALAQLEQLGDFARAYCMLRCPEAAAQSNALQNLFYGAPGRRLPDGVALQAWLEPLTRPHANEPVFVPPFENFRQRAYALSRAINEAEWSDQQRGLPLELYFSGLEFERVFPAQN